MTADSPQGEVFEHPAKASVDTSSTKRRDHAATIAPPGKSIPDRLAADCEFGEGTAKVLTPAKAPTWQASSFDLLTGATAEEFTDTIPGDLYDELFSTRG
jgi:hypothetical protein